MGYENSHVSDVLFFHPFRSIHEGLAAITIKRKGNGGIRTEIYYFSGTGNSLFIARQLGARLPGSRLIPIVRLLDEEFNRSSASTVGFVFPVHALTVPMAVRRFLRKPKFPSAEYLFAVATRQGTTFCGFPLIDRLLAGQCKRLDAHFILNMGNNESRREGYQGPDGIRDPGTRRGSDCDTGCHRGGGST